MTKKVDIIATSFGSKTRTTTTLDFMSEVKASRSVKRQIKEDVGDFLIDTILERLSNQQTPVSGEGYKKTLSKKYKNKKVSEGGSSVPDMELKGDMLDALKFKNTVDGIEIGFFNKQAWKADGHLKFSGSENLTPRRRFLPGDGQNFKRDIESEIQKIIAERLNGEG